MSRFQPIQRDGLLLTIDQDGIELIGACYDLKRSVVGRLKCLANYIMAYKDMLAGS